VFDHAALTLIIRYRRTFRAKENGAEKFRAVEVWQEGRRQKKPDQPLRISGGA
jgi:hypothetical protein